MIVVHYAMLADMVYDMLNDNQLIFMVLLTCCICLLLDNVFV